MKNAAASFVLASLLAAASVGALAAGSRPELTGGTNEENPSLDRLIEVLERRAPKGFAQRFSKRFREDPALLAVWASLRAPSRASETATAADLLAALRAEPRWGGFLAESAKDPDFKEAVNALRKAPELSALQAEQERLLRVSKTPPPGGGPGAHDVAPLRATAAVGATGDWGWRASVLPRLSRGERERIDRTCFQDERKMSFWQCCAAAGIGACDRLCAGGLCGAPPALPPPGRPGEDPFDWAKANELRHKLSGQGDKRGAYAQIDLILGHSLMDPYMLQILSGWETPSSNAARGAATHAAKAIANLFEAAAKYPGFRFLKVAANVRAAELAAAAGDPEQAKRLFMRAIGVDGRGLEGYRALAFAGLQKLSENGGNFDWTYHNELRDQLRRIGDEEGSFREIDTILAHSIMDGYMLHILSEWTLGTDTAAAIGKLLASADRYPGNGFVGMAARIEAGDLYAGIGRFGEAIEAYSAVATGGGCGGAESPDERARAGCRYWKLAHGKLEALRQAGAGDDPTVWPNAWSQAISDPWIAKHHDSIRAMSSRVLALNFVNGRTNEEMEALLKRVFAGLEEGSRYHGYESGPPAFLRYSIAKSVDLTDRPVPAGSSGRNSSKYPRRARGLGGWGFDYARLFRQEFADLIGIADPSDPTRNLTLCGLLDRGVVHEVWIYGDADKPDVTAAEVLEYKQKYDAQGRPVRGKFERCAGNGCFDEAPPCGRTVRIPWVNNTRGPGCLIHSLGHGLEWLANSNAVPYFSSNFKHFANLDLDSRLGLPFQSWYGACGYGQDCLTYTGENSLVWKRDDGRTGTIDALDQGCGNVHFPPNARTHYDDVNATPVLSTCEHYGLRDGEGGKDRPAPYTKANSDRYNDLAGDCAGGWQVYWRQNFPGYRNPATGGDGRPMKNWWPYLFY